MSDGPSAATPPSTLTLLVVSPRVAPGLLSREAWRTLDAVAASGPGRVLAAAPDDPLPAAVTTAGVEVGGVTDPAASEHPAVLARVLVDAAGEHDVVWLGSPDGDPGLADAVAVEVSRRETPPDVEVLVGSWDVQGGRLLDAVAVMDRLRSPGGCPWVAAQDHATLAPFVSEEAEETREALAAVVADPGDADARAELADELGDLLFQVVFHARVAEDDPVAPFDVDDVAAALVDKLVRRNPHVFADAEASTLPEIEAQWQAIKAQEKAARTR